MTAKLRAMMTSLPAVATMLLGLLCRFSAPLRWRDGGWGTVPVRSRN